MKRWRRRSFQSSSLESNWWRCGRPLKTFWCFLTGSFMFFLLKVSAFRCRCFIHIFQFYSQTRMKLLSVCSAPVSQLLPWTCVVPNTGVGCCCGQVMPGRFNWTGGCNQYNHMNRERHSRPTKWIHYGDGIIIASFWPFHPEMMLLLLVPSMIDLPWFTPMSMNRIFIDQPSLCIFRRVWPPWNR